MRNNRPWTQLELDEYGKEYCKILQNRVQKHRWKGKNRHYGQWVIPIVAVACASKIAPFVKERGHNCENLMNPHSTLYASYPSVKKRTKPSSIYRRTSLRGRPLCRATCCAQSPKPDGRLWPVYSDSRFGVWSCL